MLSHPCAILSVVVTSPGPAGLPPATGPRSPVGTGPPGTPDSRWTRRRRRGLAPLLRLLPSTLPLRPRRPARLTRWQRSRRTATSRAVATSTRRASWRNAKAATPMALSTRPGAAARAVTADGKRRASGPVTSVYRATSLTGLRKNRTTSLACCGPVVLAAGTGPRASYSWQLWVAEERSRGRATTASWSGSWSRPPAVGSGPARLTAAVTGRFTSGTALCAGSTGRRTGSCGSTNMARLTRAATSTTNAGTVAASTRRTSRRPTTVSTPSIICRRRAGRAGRPIGMCGEITAPASAESAGTVAV